MPQSSPSRSKRRLFRIATATVVVLAGGAGYYWSLRGAKEKRTPAPPPIPVSVAVVKRQDVPIFLSGLGAVQALNTVPIHSQVDGQLTEIDFTEGQHVTKGDVLAKIDPRVFQAAYDQALAKKAQDEASLISADKDLTRAKTLVVRSFQTEQAVDQQQAKVDGLKASIKADDAAIESARTQLEYTTITSPIDGRAGFRQIDLGRIIHANDAIPLVVITQTQPSTVVFTLPEAHLERLREAMARGPVEVTAFDQDNAKALATGKLLLIDAVIDQASATMRLKAVFPNSDERLWPGEFVNSRVRLGVAADALTIPLAAVQRGPGGLFAWVIGNDDRAQMRPIRSGPAADDIAVVADGLEVGERVVTEGYYRLEPNTRVAIKPAKERSAEISAEGRPP